MARSFVSARASVLLLGTVAVLAAFACTSGDDARGLPISPPPTGDAGAGGSGASGGGGGRGGVGGVGGSAAGGMGGGSSLACRTSLPPVSASYLAADPDAGDSGASLSDAGTPPTDGGALDGGAARGDAGADLAVPRRIRVVVDSTLPFSVGMIQELGPGVVLLGEPSRSGVLLTIDLLVSTSQPWVDILVSCDEAGPGPLTFAFVLHAASIDASASYAHLIHGQ